MGSSFTRVVSSAAADGIRSGVWKEVPKRCRPLLMGVGKFSFRAVDTYGVRMIDPPHADGAPGDP